jgi:hypothetical protein
MYAHLLYSRYCIGNIKCRSTRRSYWPESGARGKQLWKRDIWRSQYNSTFSWRIICHSRSSSSIYVVPERQGAGNSFHSGVKYIHFIFPFLYRTLLVWYSDPNTYDFGWFVYPFPKWYFDLQLRHILSSRSFNVGYSQINNNRRVTISYHLWPSNALQ